MSPQYEDEGVTQYHSEKLVHVTIGSPLSLECRDNGDVVIFIDLATRGAAGLEKCACWTESDFSMSKLHMYNSTYYRILEAKQCTCTLCNRGTTHEYALNKNTYMYIRYY